MLHSLQGCVQKPTAQKRVQITILLQLSPFCAILKGWPPSIDGGRAVPDTLLYRLEQGTRDMHEVAYDLAGRFITVDMAAALVGAKVGDRVEVTKGDTADYITLTLTYRVTKGQAARAPRQLRNAA